MPGALQLLPLTHQHVNCGRINTAIFFFSNAQYLLVNYLTNYYRSNHYVDWNVKGYGHP